MNLEKEFWVFKDGENSEDDAMSIKFNINNCTTISDFKNLIVSKYPKKYGDDASLLILQKEIKKNETYEIIKNNRASINNFKNGSTFKVLKQGL